MLPPVMMKFSINITFSIGIYSVIICTALCAVQWIRFTQIVVLDSL